MKAPALEKPAELPYDVFAPIYNHFFGPEAAQATFAALERLLLPDLSPRSRVLDLCCGTGELSNCLVQRGHEVVGVDSSAGMLQFARLQVPEAEFHQADIREFRPTKMFDAVVSAYNSLPHITSSEELLQAFQNVRYALRSGGVFVFDLYSESAYAERWRGSFSKVDDDFVCVVRASFDPVTRIGENLVTAFRRDGDWKRTDFRLVTRCHRRNELYSLLQTAGFDHIADHDAQRDLRIPGAAGRVFWFARRR